MSVFHEAVLAFTLQDRKSTSAALVLASASGLLVVVLANVSSGTARLLVLQAALVFIGIGELLGALGQGLLTRPLFARAHAPDHPFHRVTTQDFSLYNAAVAIALFCAALDPPANSVIISLYSGLSFFHGAAHLIRSSRSRGPDRGAHLRLGLPLVVAALALILLRP